MSSISVTNRINIGYAILTFAIMCLAGMAYVAVNKLGTGYQDYRATARQTLMINNLVEDMFEARIAAFQYRVNPTDQAAAEVRDNIDEILRDAQDPLLQSASPAVQAEILKIAELAQVYKNAFNDMSNIRNRILALGQQLDATHQDLAASTQALQQVASSVRTYDILLPESTVRAGIVLGKEAANNFVATGEPRAYELSQASLAQAAQALRDLAAVANQRPSMNWAASVTATTQKGLIEIETYQATLRDIQSEWVQLLEIGKATLDSVGPEMQSGLESSVDAVIARQDELGPEGQRVVDSILGATPVIGAIAFVLSLLIAYVIGRWIKVPLQRLANTTQELAQGNVDVEILGAQEDHELGHMAKSLEVFRETMRRDLEAAELAAAESAEQQMVVSTLSDALTKLADGRLDQRLNTEFKEIYEPLRLNFNETLDRLEATLGEVVLASQNVETGVADINLASEDLSQRTANQAATLEQSAAALDTLTESIKSSAAQTQEVDQTAQAARCDAQDSKDVVAQAVDAMGRIENSSQQISSITDVISDISFQTNLLALNAGVEAARAGEAGRGFAVVASEVRALAQRSSEATQEVSALINKSSAEVTEGTNLVRKAGEALEKIVAAVDKVSQLTTHMTSSANEQALGITEINTGVSMLDGVTQKNASMVETSYAQGQRLVVEAKRLEKLVQQFRLSVGAGSDTRSGGDLMSLQGFESDVPVAAFQRSA